YLGVVDLGARFPGKITYHSSCHLLRELGVDRQPRALLANVREAQFVELPHTEECCGFGGVFSVEHPEISTAMLQRKMDYIDASGAPVVVSCDAGCVTNINGGLHRQGKPQRAVHIAEVLVKT
ncbi:MAG: (Fe-S)-binding protein, partial [Anaerolineales bacterium]|nr:(Fe-S)-binding protein [Anaerolineales bacterium]